MQKIETKIIYPIFIHHLGCPFQCIYCDQHKIAKIEAVSGRQKDKDGVETENHCYDVEQIKKFVSRHKNRYKEIAFYGGSFTCLSREEISLFFSQITPLIDDKTFFRISTRPEALNDEILFFLKSCRVNTIELGIQSFSDQVLIASKRGYTSEIAESGCKLVLRHGFNLSVQLLIGLPKEDMSSIRENIHKLIDIKPEYVRLYPLLVLKDTELETLYKNGKYIPLSVKEAVEKCSLYLKECETHGIKVIKIGLHADIAKEDIIAGPFHERFGELVREFMSH